MYAVSVSVYPVCIHGFGISVFNLALFLFRRVYLFCVLFFGYPQLCVDACVSFAATLVDLLYSYSTFFLLIFNFALRSFCFYNISFVSLFFWITCLLFYFSERFRFPTETRKEKNRFKKTKTLFSFLLGNCFSFSVHFIRFNSQTEANNQTVFKPAKFLLFSNEG